MRALAEFVMRGRAQAIGVAMAGILMPFFLWFGIAAVGLVALRKDGADAFVVFGWALLAAFASLLWQGDIGPVAALLATTFGALMLRWTSLWPLALMVLLAVGLAVALILNVFGSAYVDQLVALLNELLARVQQQVPQQARTFEALNAVQVSGWLGFWAAASGFAGLVLARYWQALLYNPEGFGREFQQLRLPPQIVMVLLVIGTALILPGPDYRMWLMLVAMPFVVSGLALVHGMAALKQWGRGPLVTLYVAWVFLMGPVTATLFLLALIDSWVDFRGRFKASSG